MTMNLVRRLVLIQKRKQFLFDSENIIHVTDEELSNLVWHTSSEFVTLVDVYLSKVRALGAKDEDIIAFIRWFASKLGLRVDNIFEEKGRIRVVWNTEFVIAQVEKTRAIKSERSKSIISSLLEHRNV